MIRLSILLLALWPACAVAGADLTYGVALEPGGKPSEIRLSRCEAGCFARVAYVNRFLRGGAWTRQFTLNLDGFAVTVTVLDGEGLAPERIQVTPPPGFVVEPAEIAVEEGATGVIAIHPLPLS